MVVVIEGLLDVLIAPFEELVYLLVGYDVVFGDGSEQAD